MTSIITHVTDATLLAAEHSESSKFIVGALTIIAVFVALGIVAKLVGKK